MAKTTDNAMLLQETAECLTNDRSTDRSIMAEIEKDVISTVYSVHVSEMVDNIVSVCEERNEVRSQFIEESENVEKLKIDINNMANEKKVIQDQRDFQEKAKNDLDLLVRKLEKENQEFEASIQKLVKEKTQINDAKTKLEADIVTLNEKWKDLNESVRADALRRRMSERDEARKERDKAQASLEDEKLKLKKLKERTDRESNETRKKISTMQEDADKHAVEKKKSEKDHADLKKEILRVNNSLAKTQKEYDDTKGKLKVSEENTPEILKILEDASLIGKSKKKDDIITSINEGIKHHVKEVEAIKKASRDNERIVDEMKKQLELLEASVAKADKGKSFWKMVSYVIIVILAAVCLAYVARGGY